MIQARRMQRLLARRQANSHKGDYGHVFVLAGSVGLTGAAYLTSQASLLSGSGLVTLGIPRSLNALMELKLTEVMTKPLKETSSLSLSLGAFAQIDQLLQKADVLAIGPGLSQHPQTQKLVRKILLTTNKPVVLDADGINAVAGHLNILTRAKSDLIITPHPGEMARLLNTRIEQVQNNRIKLAKTFAKKYNLVVVLKGHKTVVLDPKGNLYINRTGNPGMATAGCGDVLTGIIASFLGQGLDSFTAAKLAVYVHGLAADLAAKKKGYLSLVASDILAKLHQVLKKFR